MKRKYYYRRFGEVPKELLKELKGLTLKNYPESDLKYRVRNPDQFYNARLFCDYRRGELVGWALVEHDWDFVLGRHYKARFYVKYGHRRKGVGTRLVRKVKAKMRPMKKKICVCAHSSHAEAFFNATNMKHRWCCWSF